ncbi:MAG: hypothetical protein JNL64_00930 [Blastocatellia bacterium]|nr:hypothetical protein [Blastocatellia bacterium]
MIERTVAKIVTLIAIIALVVLGVLAALGRMASKKERPQIKLATFGFYGMKATI